MSNFNSKTITSKGLELLSAALAGGTLEFTRIVMGSGTYEGDIGLIESLVSQKQSLDIKSITRKGSQVVLSTTLLQSAIVEDFYWKELGVFAKGTDGVEKLYMYGSASEASYISRNILNEKMINIGVLVSNATNITATINNSLVYLNQNDLEAHNNDANAHRPIRDLVTNLFANLTLSWSKITEKPSTYPPSVHEHNAVTTSANGFMSATDKVKLDGIATNANNYVHPGSGTNPHGTTKTDVGLSSVVNYGVATTAQAQAGIVDTAYMTPLKTMQEIEAWYEANRKLLGGDYVNKKTNSFTKYLADASISSTASDVVLITLTGSGMFHLKYMYGINVTIGNLKVTANGVTTTIPRGEGSITSPGYMNYLNAGISSNYYGSDEIIIPYSNGLTLSVNLKNTGNGTNMTASFCVASLYYTD